MSLTVSNISVVICAYARERWDDLVAAVASVQQQLLPPQEIIVVIDHNPALLEMAQKQFADVIVVPNREERGLSGARNSGIAIAKGQVIAFLDDDAQAAHDWLFLFNQALDDQCVLGVGGQVEPMWEGQKPGWLPPEFYWVVGCSYTGMPETLAAIRNPIGASMCIRREVFEEVGGFRNGIGRVGTRPVGCEETELCIRARQHWPGRLFLYQPQARVFHRVPTRRACWRYFCSRCYAEGISKAFVARHVGVQDSLSSERAYTLRTLPYGLLYNLGVAVGRGDFGGLQRGAAIILGLCITAAGYISGKCFSRKNEIEYNRKIETSLAEQAVAGRDYSTMP